MRSGVRHASLWLFSLVVTAFLLFSVFAVHTGLAGRSFIPPAVLALAAAVAFRYAAVYHRFSNPAHRALALVPFVVTAAAGALALEPLLTAVSVDALRDVFGGAGFRFGASEFLPVWWPAVLLVPAGVLALLGSVNTRDFSPYPKPTAIRELARSPVYFGAVCAFFGLWAVLFVGIAIQRIVVIAPVFEELLKFGVALMVGSALFGRSMAARIGIAVVVGAVFGLVEHATTYPTEADTVYLFRTLFHTMMTVLSVSAYTAFESRGETALSWIAPAYSTLFHFFYNTFVVLWAVISVTVYGGQTLGAPLFYESVVLLLATVLVLFAVFYRRGLIALYRPLEYVLSDLV